MRITEYPTSKLLLPRSFPAVASLFLLVLGLVWSAPAWGYDPHANLTKDNKAPKELEGLGIQEVTGRQLAWDIPFQDHEGKQLLLSDLGKLGKPILLSHVYYKCPMLCNLHMNGVMKVMKSLDWTAGKEYLYVAFSFQPKETTEVSGPKQLAYLQDYARPGAEKGIILLTGTQESIAHLTEELGFRYRWDDESQQFIHASAVYVLTPQGEVSRIFQGIDWEALDLKLSLMEASRGKIGGIMDQMALFCFQFDPYKNKYTIYAFRMMQIGGGLTLLLLGIFLWGTWRKQSYQSNV